MLKLLTAALCAAATSACAYGFAPAATSVNGTGTLFISGQACAATGVRFQIGGTGHGLLTAVNPVRCPSVGFSALPWRMVAKSATTGVVDNVSWTTPQGVCGPLTMKMLVNSNLVTINAGSGSCSMMMTVTTSPVLQIAP
jgi:hypothetical protein